MRLASVTFTPQAVASCKYTAGRGEVNTQLGFGQVHRHLRPLIMTTMLLCIATLAERCGACSVVLEQPVRSVQ